MKTAREDNMGAAWKRLHRNLAIGCTAAVGLALSASAGIAAEWKPDKPVELVIGNAPGGAMDRMA
jgi:putative tricarboxylic transport membrane protein